MSVKKTNAYQKLTEISKKAAVYASIGNVLSWDQETYMPAKGIDLRSKQNELIASLVHQEKTSKEFAKALGSLIDLETGKIVDSDLSDRQKAALREWRRDYLHSVKLPTSFVEEFAKVTSPSIMAWQKAKENNDFISFAPHLEKIIDLSRKKADLLGYEDHPYDALLDLFEPSVTTKELTTLFERLKFPLTNLLKKIQSKLIPDDSFVHHLYPQEKQKAFGKKILSEMGFDESFSRLDETSHPFCMPVDIDDIRLTTRIYPNNLIVNIMSCIHEGGHGLYHAHLPREDVGTPLSEAASYGIDESQSRMWETIFGRSLPFWEYYFPKLQQVFPEHLKSVRLDDFYKALNIVRPTLIRTDSDEVTYNLHIMVRFELERKLIEGTLQVQQIPEIWNEKMRQYLGITPKADSEGCLQDIHWSMGALGYFPTYSLGNLYAAQFFETFEKTFPNWKEKVAKGDLLFIGEWQKEKIHRFGREYLPEDLCEKVTGKSLSEKPYIHYLESKYTPLYHLS